MVCWSHDEALPSLWGDSSPHPQPGLSGSGEMFAVLCNLLSPPSCDEATHHESSPLCQEWTWIGWQRGGIQGFKDTSPPLPYFPASDSTSVRLRVCKKPVHTAVQFQCLQSLACETNLRSPATGVEAGQLSFPPPSSPVELPA